MEYPRTPLVASGSGEATPLWAHLLSALIVLVFTGLALYEVSHLRRVLRSAEYVLKAQLTVGSQPNTPGAFIAPVGLAVDAEHVYVTDVGEKSLRIYTAEDGHLLRTVTKGGDGTSDLASPTDVTVAPHGGVQLIDSATGRVEMYATDGTPAGVVSCAGLGMYNPHGLAVTPNGDYVITDSGNGRVWRLSTSGKELWVYKGSSGSGGSLVEPRAVAVDSRGHIAFADSGTARVYELDAKGAPFRSTRLSGSLMALAVMGQQILVTAAAPETLWLLGPDGETLPLNDGTGKAFLSNPQGVAVDPKGRVWIVTGGQVKRYGLTKRRER